MIIVCLLGGPDFKINKTGPLLLLEWHNTTIKRLNAVMAGQWIDLTPEKYNECENKDQTGTDV